MILDQRNRALDTILDHYSRLPKEITSLDLELDAFVRKILKLPERPSKDRCYDSQAQKLRNMPVIDYPGCRNTVLLYAYLQLCNELGLHRNLEPEVVALRTLLNTASKLTVKGVDYLANECDIIAPQLRQILSIDD
jgi:hypothetical protein